MQDQTPKLEWNTHSDGMQCPEYAEESGRVFLRDSAAPEAVVSFDPEPYKNFIKGEAARLGVG